jgi:CRISPR/Cas system-associated protein Cas7 (RAMP superfamily)
MKQVFIVPVHSFVDVITNSSTMTFICDTDKKIEEIREILQKLLDVYNEKFKSSLTLNIFNIRKINEEDEISEHEEAIIIEEIEDYIIPPELHTWISELFNARSMRT